MTRIQLLNRWNDVDTINSYVTGAAYCFLVDRQFHATSLWKPNEPLVGCGYWHRNSTRLVNITVNINTEIRRGR